MQRVFNWSYRKVGGLHFIKLGRLGCSFYISRPKSILEVQRMHCTKYRNAVNLNEVERALTARVAELNARGVTMEVNCNASARGDW